MSLRWSSYVAPKSPKEGLKNARRPISVKNRTSLAETLLQSFFVWKLSAQSCKAFIGLTNRAKMISRGNHFYLKFWIKVTVLERNRSFFARSDSAVKPSEKVQLTLIGSPLRAFEWAQDEHRTLSLSLQRVARRRSVRNLNNKLR